jgi:hypothetical protein
MTAHVRYVGMVYDVLSYESIVSLPVPTTVSEVASAEREALDALFAQKPGVISVRTKVTVGFGYQPPIVIVATGEVYSCAKCGGEGHRADRCPHEV